MNTLSQSERAALIRGANGSAHYGPWRSQQTTQQNGGDLVGPWSADPQEVYELVADNGRIIAQVYDKGDAHFIEVVREHINALTSPCPRCPHLDMILADLHPGAGAVTIKMMTDDFPDGLTLHWAGTVQNLAQYLKTWVERVADTPIHGNQRVLELEDEVRQLRAELARRG